MGDVSQGPQEQSTTDIADSADDQPAQSEPHLIKLPRESFTHVGLAANVHEILLMFGRTDQQVDLGTNSLVVLGIDGSEFAHSPVAAKVLMSGLNVLIDRYEKEHGKIPDDPVVQVRLQEPDGSSQSK